MPSKKVSQNHGVAEKGSQRPSSPLFKEDGDPIETVISVVEKKGRNLSKRKERLNALQKEREEGKELDKDQLDAISKLPDILVQIEFLHEMQKQFSELHSEYQRHLKAKLRGEEKRKKEERQLQKTSLAYCLRIQLILEQMDEETKKAFRNGSDGAVQLSETELKQIDEFYNLVHPQRPRNASFDQDVISAVQHLTLLHEESANKVVGSTYKALYKVFNKIDSCGYLNIEQDVPEEETQEEEEELVEVLNDDQNNEFTGLEEVQTVVLDDPSSNYHQQKIEELSIIQEQEVLQSSPTPLTGPKFGHVPPTTEPMHQPIHVSTSAPSPDFAGLGSNTMPAMDFQFMRGDPQPPSAQTTPSSFPTTFSTQDNQPIVNTSSQPDVPYVPETGQQMNEKSDLVGTPVVGGSSDKMAEQPNNGSFKSQGNGRSSYDSRRSYQRPNNGNNRQRPYNRSRDSRRDGGYNDSRRDGGYNDSRRDGGYNDSRKDGGYGDSRRDGNYGDSRGGGSNRMEGGRPRGGRGRPNYPYGHRQPQNHRSNGTRNTTTVTTTNRPQQPSYASTAAAQS